jgi:hypothetical protein
MKTKYLPLQQYHIVEITALEPDVIKSSAKNAHKDREKIPHTTLLNAIVRSLGCKGGFASYKNHVESRLKPFMEQHGLKTQADLVSFRKKGFGIPITNCITPQKLSERIFFSGWKMPEKVFTGYNFDFENTISGGNRILAGMSSNSLGLEWGFSEDIICHNISLAQKNPNQLIAIDENTNRRLIDVVVGGFNLYYSPSFHLLGDSLIKAARYESEVKLYNTKDYHDELLKEKERNKLMFSIFRQRIEESEEGWVDILPFNDNLVFLRGQNGEYDFLFKNQRDNLFEHKAFGGALKIKDVPWFIEDYHFARWEYFEYQGWRERDEHEAENLFYNSGGTAGHYPSSQTLRQTYYETNRNYSANRKPKSNQFHKDFVHTVIADKHLAVSNLISIEDFDEFVNARPDYMKARKGDSLAPVNDETDTHLPVTLTWYDALMYAGWFKEKTQLPVRLLTYPEYTAMRENFRESVAINGQEAGWKEDYNDVVFFDGKGIPFEDHPPYCDPETFCRFNPSIKKTVLDNGLIFYLSNSFAEWLLEKTCIRTGNLTSFGCLEYVIRDAPPLDSTGKYKHTKIGFRLCYDLDS